MREVPPPRRLYLTAEYGSSSVWAADGQRVGMVRAEELPLSPATVERLRAWSARMWDLLEAEDEHGRCEPALQHVHDEEGRELWLDVQAELGPEYEVGYRPSFHVARHALDHTAKVLWDPGELEVDS